MATQYFDTGNLFRSFIYDLPEFNGFSGCLPDVNNWALSSLWNSTREQPTKRGRSGLYLMEAPMPGSLTKFSAAGRGTHVEPAAFAAPVCFPLRYSVRQV